jgi:ABC-type glycerol-3-phosphate transport system substrate-binding protein
MPGARAAAGLIVLALCACGGGSATSPQKAVDETTQAVYNDDLNAMQAHFDDSLSKQVTIDGVSSLSQKLKAFGAYKGLTQTAADANGGRYDYDAAFDNATMAVHVRMDGDGHIAAYRIDVPQNVVARK